MRGWCMCCYRLLKIRPHKGECYPLPHPAPPVHAICKTPLVPIETEGVEPDTFHCPKCGELSYPEDVERPRKLCEGSAHAIR